MSKVRKAWPSFVLLVVLFVACFGSAAADTRRIVIVTDHDDTTIIPLLRGELRQLGLDILEVRAPDNNDVTRELTQTAHQYHAVAAFRVRVSSHTVEVWIADRANGRVSQREVFTQGSDSSAEARLIVLQAVELLRWSLKDIEPRRSADEPRTRDTQVIEPGPTHRNAVTLAAAPYALVSPGGTSPGVGAQLDLTIRWSFIGTRLTYAQPLLPASLQSMGNRADLCSYWLSMQMVLLDSRMKDIRPSLGVGVAMLRTTLHGIAAAPSVATDDRLLTAAPIIDARVGLVVAPRVSLFAGVSGLVPLRSDNIVFEGRSVGSYGKVILAPALGVELGLL